MKVIRVLYSLNSICVTFTGGLIWTPRCRPTYLPVSLASPISCLISSHLPSSSTSSSTAGSTSDGPWKKLGLDILGPFETAVPACRYAVTLTIYYSKWPELAFCPSTTTDAVLVFLTTVLSSHGNLETILQSQP